MSQPLTKKNYIPGSLRAPRSARTLLLRMAADQERAERVRQLKADHPEIKWRMVAEHVGVTERAAQEWPKSGGIEPTNAKKLAELFDVSYEWLWFGREVVAQNDGTPDPFAGQPTDPTEQLDRIELLLKEARSERDAIRELLKEQEDILNDMRRVADRFPDDDSIEHLTATMRDLADRAEADAAARDEDASTQADTRRQTR